MVIRDPTRVFCQATSETDPLAPRKLTPLFLGEVMGKKRGKLGFRQLEVEMVGSETVGQLFALRRLGWGTRRIAEELGISRNTVKVWLRKGP